MTFSEVIIKIAVCALICTAGLFYFTDRIKKPILSFLQNFCGFLFIFSGAVKAVDPLGTAYKMEQYFGEFETTFSETWFDFLSGIFPYLSTYAIGFSVLMIVLEIVVGIMFVIGARLKWASWIFLLLIVFFTILTGFTYLTGYVPSGENFFSFGKWSAYAETNMRVTDCGCFGDFLTIPPRTSFIKDVFLLLPGLVFVFLAKEMHQLFDRQTRNIVVGISVIALIWYCMSNFSWDIPHADFRPFREDVNIRQQRQAELDASNAVEVIGYLIKNSKTGEEKEVGSTEFLANMTTKYKKPDWKVIDQIKTEPTMKATKLSEFVVSNFEGYDAADDLMNEQGFSFWIVSYTVPHQVTYTEKLVEAVTYQLDSTMTQNIRDSLIQLMNQSKSTKIQIPNYEFKPTYLSDLKDEIGSLLMAVDAPVHGMFGGIDFKTMASLQMQSGLELSIYEADDILLKTIVRSNPGLVLMKNGTVLKKWHVRNLPTPNQLKALMKIHE